MMHYDTILFDLGGTLIDYRGPVSDWSAMERLGLGAIYSHLHSNCQPHPPLDLFQDVCFAELEVAWPAAVRGERNLLLAELVSGWLARHGLACDDLLVDRAVQDYTAAISCGARPMAGAHNLLQTLTREGRRLGLISNTMWPPSAHVADLRRFGLLPYLDGLLFSAERELWKPDPRVFALALAELGSTASRAVFVGDNPHDDVFGAQQAGLRAIWLRTPEYPPDAGAAADAVVDDLLEIRDVLAAWEGAAASVAETAA